MTTGFQEAGDKLRIFYRLSPVENAQGNILIVHGFAEHSQRYGHVVQHLNGSGFSVASIDLRGHGHSEGSRGYIERFSDYLEDVETGCKIVAEHLGDAPLYLLGHSMGGLIVATYAAQNPEGLAGIALSSPAMGFAVKIPAWKRILGEAMSKLLPHFSIPADVDAGHLSHDIEVVSAYEKDPMVFGTARARWYTEMVEAQQLIMESCGHMALPMLLQTGDDDRIVDSGVGRSFYEEYKGDDKTLHVYQGFFHEIFNEVERDRPLSDLQTWLQNR